MAPTTELTTIGGPDGSAPSRDAPAPAVGSTNPVGRPLTPIAPLAPIVLFLSLLAVAVPWLSWRSQPILGLWVIGAVIVAVAVVRGADSRRSLVPTLTDGPLGWLALAILTAGMAVAGVVLRTPFYGSSAWLAVGQGLVIAGSAVVVASTMSDERFAEWFVIGASAAGFIGLIGLPLAVQPSAVSQLLSTFGSGSADQIMFRGYRPLYEALAQSPRLLLPEGRGTNLRHEPALLFVLALAPLTHQLQRPLLVKLARYGAMIGVLASLSRSAIAAALVVLALDHIGSWHRRTSPGGMVAYLVGLGLVGLLTASQMGAGLTDRFGGQGDFSAERRSDALASAYRSVGRNLAGSDLGDLGPEFLRPHVFALDAYLGAGVLGIVAAGLLLVMFVSPGARAFSEMLARRATPLHGIVLAACVVATVRYFTAGSFLNSSVAWYAGGLVVVYHHRRLRSTGP